MPPDPEPGAGGPAEGADEPCRAEAERLVRLAIDAGLTCATAESLTGGRVVERLVGIPGASGALRGGVVAYVNDVKAGVLGVGRCLLARRGSVDPDVALEMARGARRLLGADVGLATTGVAGPLPHDGRPVGTVYVAASWAGGDRVEALALDGDREAIRGAATLAALRLASSVLSGGEAGNAGEQSRPSPR